MNDFTETLSTDRLIGENSQECLSFVNESEVI